MNEANPFDAAPPVEPPATPPNGVRFLGIERDFWRLLTRGAALLLVTLGIYRFWLATDVRRFLWSNTEIAGDGLEYIGTARELLLGFLIAIALLVPVNIAFFLANQYSSAVQKHIGTRAIITLSSVITIAGMVWLALLGAAAGPWEAISLSPSRRRTITS